MFSLSLCVSLLFRAAAASLYITTSLLLSDLYHVCLFTCMLVCLPACMHAAFNVPVTPGANIYILLGMVGVYRHHSYFLLKQLACLLHSISAAEALVAGF